MEMRTFGRSGMQLSILGFGCGAVGGLMVRGDPADQERAVAQALAAGALGRLFPARRKFEERRRRANLAAEFVTLALGFGRVRLDALQHHGGPAADTLRCGGSFID